MKKTILLILLFVFGGISIKYAQQAEELIDEGKKLLKKADVYFDDDMYLKARGLFERASFADNENFFADYYLAYTDYRLAVYYMQTKDNIQFENYIESATKELKSLLEKDENNAEVISLLGTVYGIQVSRDPSLGPSLGSQNVALTSQALGIEPNNPRVLLQIGISKLNTPEFFGGSKTKALEYFKKSVKAFETSGESITNIEWGYLDALAWLGITYDQLKDYNSAIETFNKALEIEPNFSWVKNNLLPSAQEKLASQK
jgi:tetratricopeptide (TPR) repeat protein